MKSSATLKKFIFNEKIDADFLFSLYEDDYAYIAEVFQTTLNHFEEDMGQITLAYDDQDMEGFRKAVHKFKPIFGFIGLTNYQKEIGDIELSLGKPMTSEALTVAYNTLKSIINDGRDIIETDNKRLLDYSASNV